MKKLMSAVVSTALSLSAVAVCLGGCKKEPPAWQQHTFFLEDLSATDTRETLPHGLWEKIAAVIPKPAPGGHGGGEHGGGEHAEKKEEGHGEGAKEGVKEEGKEAKKEGEKEGEGGKSPVLKIFLVEKNKGLLPHGNTQLVFGPGGGTIDLSTLLSTKKGSFHLVAQFMPDVPDQKVFFYSDSAVRKVGDETWGSGCDTYFDVTTAFQKAATGEGLLINTAEGGATSALAGTLYFVAVREGKLFLASLTIKDSGHPQWLCQR